MSNSLDQVSYTALLKFSILCVFARKWFLGNRCSLSMLVTLGSDGVDYHARVFRSQGEIGAIPPVFRASQAIRRLPLTRQDLPSSTLSLIHGWPVCYSSFCLKKHAVLCNRRKETKKSA
jgi:hypothetical protein